MELITGAPDAQYGDKSSLVVNATTKSGLGARSRSAASKPTGDRSEPTARMRTFGWGTASSGISSRSTASAPAFSGHAGVPAVSRHRQQRKHLRPHRLSAERARRVPPESVPGAQLVPGSQQLRSVEPGPEAARADLERRARLSAHLRLDHAADGQSVRAARSGELLRQPRSLRRHAGHRVAEPLSDQLRREGRCCHVAQAAQPQVRNCRSSRRGCWRISRWASPIRFQSGMPGTGRDPAGVAGGDESEPVQRDQSRVRGESEPAPRAGAVRSDARRIVLPLPRRWQHQPVRFLRHRRHQAGRFHRQHRPAGRPVQRPGFQERHRSRGWAFPIW